MSLVQVGRIQVTSSPEYLFSINPDQIRTLLSQFRCKSFYVFLEVLLQLQIMTQKTLYCAVSVALKLSDLINLVLRPGLQIRRKIQPALYGKNLLRVDTPYPYTVLPVSPLNNHFLSGKQNSFHYIQQKLLKTHFIRHRRTCSFRVFGMIFVCLLCCFFYLTDLALCPSFKKSLEVLLCLPDEVD